YSEARGRYAGYEWPQLSIHRADLHEVLWNCVVERLGPDALVLSKKCVSVHEGGTVVFEDGSSATGSCVIGCDGIHSAVRRQLFPGEGPPAYQGINMWRGTTRMKPFLGGSSMAVAGWLEVGKLVIYPVRPPENGVQLVNWVAEIQSPR